ncbi:helix-turn-helix domain-containing protein [Helicobacter japonicus]|uniref:helix-turn-helix domain-containing protein n=1 Tax=Helicobacter japonicus TaxID=425400 RepID=UPI0023F1ECEA|nr:helix-turn-helix transcriptional regulator [Helicobacter japonicus]
MKKIQDKYIDNAYKIIGLNVKKARELRGLTQLELSLAIGHKSVSVVSCAEIYHKRQHFNIEHLLKIAQVLEVSIQSFFEGL